MSKSKITRLLVVPNAFRYDPNNQSQEYVLIHPGYINERNRPLWGHIGSSRSMAVEELINHGNRKQFLDEVFGVNQWAFETYIVDDLKVASRYFKAVNKHNPPIDCKIIDDTIAKYKAEGKRL